jgi:hypothetical protein
VPGDRGIQADLGPVEPEAVLAELEIFFCRPAQPGGPDKPGQGYWLIFRQVAAAEGQFANDQVPADQQVLPSGAGEMRRPATPMRTSAVLWIPFPQSAPASRACCSAAR